jgi:hypothetical protein
MFSIGYDLYCISSHRPSCYPQEGRSGGRSHDSRHDDTRCMLRLDDQMREKLEGLSTHFDTSAAEVIRQLVAQATPKDFPKGWQTRAAERRADQPRR